MYKKYIVNPKENLYYLYKEDIEFETTELIKNYFPEYLETPIAIPVDSLAMKLKLDILPATLSLDNRTLGTFIFNKGIVNIYDEIGNVVLETYDAKNILIDTKLLELNNGITRFTIGHEIGHYWTQYELKHEIDGQVGFFELMNKEEKAKYILDTNKIIEASLNSKVNDIYKFSYLEWQPNYFSSCILMPKITLDMKIKEMFPNFSKQQFSSNLDNLSYNDFKNMIMTLSKTFNVSKEAMKNRLNSLEYITRRQ